MTRIGLFSDTHGFLDPTIAHHFDQCDEIWHAGDIGDPAVLAPFQDRPLRVVFGNIDHGPLRWNYPEDLIFELDGLHVYMTHIGGYPGRYNPRARHIIDAEKPGLFICGHSHILKVMPDKKRGLLHINPGAAGRHGFHKVRTAMRFEIDEGKVGRVEVIELGGR